MGLPSLAKSLSFFGVLIQVHFNPKPYNLLNWWFELVGCYQPLHEGHVLHVVCLYVLSLPTMMRSSKQMRTLTP